MKLTILFLIICSLFLFSCGKDDGEIPEDHTRIVFSQVQDGGVLAAGGSVLSGKVFIYIVRHDSPGTKRGVLVFDDESTPTTTASLDLANGQYRFYALGFTQSPLNGASQVVYCEAFNDGNPVNLTGGLNPIPLTLSQSDCSRPIFGASQFRLANTPKEIEIAHCDQAPPSTAIVSCTGIGGSDGTYTNQDFRISLVAYRPTKVADPLEGAVTLDQLTLSYCGTLTSGGLTTITSPGKLRLPVGASQGSPFYVALTVFSSTNGSCSGGVLHEYNFSRGIAKGTSDGKGVVLHTATETQIYLANP